jgi:hypothetical protein
LQTNCSDQNEIEEAEALKQIEALPVELAILRENMERVYGETRILTKPETYILDQDQHHHLANQPRSFDWLYTAELYFLEKTVKEIVIGLLCMISMVSFGQQKVNLSDELKENQFKAVNRTITPYGDQADAVEMNAAEGSDLGILKEIPFKTGTIEVELLGENNPGKSFIGIAFNFVATEQIRKEHMVQYIYHPKYTWYYLRENRTGEFENEIPLPPNPDDWFKAKIVVSEKAVKVFVEGVSDPVLNIERLTGTTSNKIGLWIGHGSSGRFRNLVLKK